MHEINSEGICLACPHVTSGVALIVSHEAAFPSLNLLAYAGMLILNRQ
jgi:hypothetical protein